MGAPIILQDPSGLAQGITGAASALGQALQYRSKKAEEDKKRSALTSALSQLPQDASPMEVQGALQQAIAQGADVATVAQLGNMFSTFQKSKSQVVTPQKVNQMATLFKKFGMDADEAQRSAEFWGEATTGGQTAIANMIVDNIQRGNFRKPGGVPAQTTPGVPGTPQAQGIPQMQTTPGIPPTPGVPQLDPEADVSSQESAQYDFPDIDEEIFGNRKPVERIALKKELLKQGNIEVKELSKSIHSADGELMRIGQLDRLNESKKLPQGPIERLNINWTTGDILIPALATPEMQLFVKTVNDFTVAAKDTFGARVTNFELGSFMRRLPTLANSEGGRRLILSQMKTMKQLDRLYEDSIRSVYDHYRVQGVDRSAAERIARGLRANDEKILKEQFENVVNAQDIYELKQGVKQGFMLVEKPDGSRGQVPIEKGDLVDKKKWKIL